MIINGKQLTAAAPLAEMLTEKMRLHGVSHGLAEAGYDIRLKQTVVYFPPDMLDFMEYCARYTKGDSINKPKADRAFYGYILVDGIEFKGRFCLAQAIELFQMPADLVGQVKDKSTWARKGLNVFNTVTEPKWNGYLTMELVFHGNEKVVIPAGCGIAQVLFGSLSENGDYGDGKYQNAADLPQGQGAIDS